MALLRTARPVTRYLGAVTVAVLIMATGSVTATATSAATASAATTTRLARPAQAAPPCPVPFDPIQGDLNGDGIEDTVIGIPAANSIQVNFGGLGSVLVPETVTGGRQSTGFGASVDVARVDSDDCADIVVGQPNSRGQVSVLFDLTGLTPSRVVTIVPPDSEVGDEFGAAVNVTGSDLWVGAPGHDVTGHADAGVLYHYHLSASGTPTLVQEMTENRADIPGSAATGDRFGGVLAADFGGIAVGLPDKAVGAAAQAGQLDIIAVDPTSGLLMSSTAYNQDTPGVPGAPTTGSHFAAAVTPDARAVGIPGANVGSATGAGAVQAFLFSGTGNALKAAGYYTQDTAGIPGTSETGDNFGATVVSGTFHCHAEVDIAVGAPGEDLATSSNAGSVTLITIPDGNDDGPLCAAQLIYAGKTIGGALTADDEVGSSLGVRPDVYGDDEDSIDELMIGVPAATVDAVSAAGLYYDWATRSFHTETMATGAVHNARFGSVFGTITVY